MARGSSHDNHNLRETIEVLRSMFTQHRLPERLVSDNGPQFPSIEFAKFLEGNQIKHIMSATYHPASDGLAENHETHTKG